MKYTQRYRYPKKEETSLGAEVVLGVLYGHLDSITRGTGAYVMIVERGDTLFSYLRLFVVSTLAGPRYFDRKSAGFTTVHVDHATTGLVPHCARLEGLPTM